MASKGTVQTTELFQAERLNNSVNGNPRFRLITRDGSFVTQSDASCSYDVDNIMREVRRNGGALFVRLSLTPAGRVWNIEQEEVTR